MSLRVLLLSACGRVRLGWSLGQKVSATGCCRKCLLQCPLHGEVLPLVAHKAKDGMVAGQEARLPGCLQPLRLFELTAVDLDLLQNLRLCHTLPWILQAVQCFNWPRCPRRLVRALVIRWDVVNHGSIKNKKLRVDKIDGVRLCVVLKKQSRWLSMHCYTSAH